MRHPCGRIPAGTPPSGVAFGGRGTGQAGCGGAGYGPGWAPRIGTVWPCPRRAPGVSRRSAGTSRRAQLLLPPGTNVPTGGVCRPGFRPSRGARGSLLVGGGVVVHQLVHDVRRTRHRTQKPMRKSEGLPQEQLAAENRSGDAQSRERDRSQSSQRRHAQALESQGEGSQAASQPPSHATRAERASSPDATPAGPTNRPGPAPLHVRTGIPGTGEVQPPP